MVFYSETAPPHNQFTCRRKTYIKGCIIKPKKKKKKKKKKSNHGCIIEITKINIQSQYGTVHKLCQPNTYKSSPSLPLLSKIVSNQLATMPPLSPFAFFLPPRAKFVSDFLYDFFYRFALICVLCPNYLHLQYTQTPVSC